MYHNNIEDLLHTANVIDYHEDVLSQYGQQEWISQFCEMTLPDFIFLLNMKLEYPIIYQEKCNPYFLPGSHIRDIFNTIRKRQLQKILNADHLVYDFAKKYNLAPKAYMYQLKFSVHLSSNELRTLQRNAIVLSTDENNHPHIILFALFDVTELYGIRNSIQCSIRGLQGMSVPDLTELKGQLSDIIFHKLYVTNREKEILDLIAEGKTSEQIGNELNISKATVNKHRQNLIKKNNVPNISALIKLINN